MVGGSELAFRLLARRHGADLAYTPMMKSELFISPKRTPRGIGQLEVHHADAPLVAHFSGNDPAMLLAAAKRAERCPGVCAIDLNLGCPQRSAHSGHFGAFLCAEQTDRLLVLRIVATLARQLTVPVFCKIRLLDEGVEETVAFAKQMEAAGCALLAVHGRYRGSPMHRRDGPAHLDQVRAIKQALSIPVLTNGNVRSAQELIDSLVLTGCDGVMSAEAALDDPAIFARAAAACAEERRALERQIEESAALKAIKRSKERKLTKEELHVLAERKTAKSRLKELPHLIAPATSASTQQPSCAPLDLADQYLELVRTHPPTGEKGEVSTEITMTHTIFHLRRLCRTLLTQYELLPILASATSIDAAAGVMQRCRDYADGVLNFTPGGEAARVEAEARAARKAANARAPS